jgi:adenylosuccinate synthase
VLDGLTEIKICTSYEHPQGGDTASPRFANEYYSEIKPVYQTVPGWQASTAGIRCFEDLPVAAKAYIKTIEDSVGAPIDILSTGSDRTETIVLKDPFQE